MVAPNDISKISQTLDTAVAAPAKDVTLVRTHSYPSNAAARLGLDVNAVSSTPASIATRRVADVERSVGLAGTASDAIDRQASSLARMRELAAGVADGSVDATAAGSAMAAWVASLDRVAWDARFSGVNVADGSTSEISLTLGAVSPSAGAGSSTSNSPDGATARTLGLVELTSKGLGLDGLDLSTSTAARDALTRIDAANARLSDYGGAVQSFRDAASTELKSARDAMVKSDVFRTVQLAMSTASELSDRLSGSRGLSSILNMTEQTNQLVLRLLG